MHTKPIHTAITAFTALLIITVLPVVAVTPTNEDQLEALEGFKEGYDEWKKQQIVGERARFLARQEEFLEKHKLRREYDDRPFTDAEKVELDRRLKEMEASYKSVMGELYDVGSEKITVEDLSDEAKGFLDQANEDYDKSRK